MAAVRGGSAMVAALVVACGLLLPACGDDGGDDAAADDTTVSTQPTETTVAAASGPLTVDNLAERCDELAPIVEALRGEAPVEVDGQEVMPVTDNGFEYVSAHCHFGYEGDTFSDKNRVDIYFDSAPDDRAGIQNLFGNAALTEIIEGLGYPASYYLGRGSDASATARALVGHNVVRVISTAPKEMADAPFVQKGPLAAALAAVLAKT